MVIKVKEKDVIRSDGTCGVCRGFPLDLEVEHLREENNQLRKQIKDLKCQEIK